mmetsp:Transcript_153554/g.490933  ORF Transcript_153554/g.490933 Transcript_153554/m.490933 type:complete len:246 (+) Transcript_153554:6155-6892(+)
MRFLRVLEQPLHLLSALAPEQRRALAEWPLRRRRRRLRSVVLEHSDHSRSPAAQHGSRSGLSARPADQRQRIEALKGVLQTLVMMPLRRCVVKLRHLRNRARLRTFFFDTTPLRFDRSAKRPGGALARSKALAHEHAAPALVTATSPDGLSSIGDEVVVHHPTRCTAEVNPPLVQLGVPTWDAQDILSQKLGLHRDEHAVAPRESNACDGDGVVVEEVIAIEIVGARHRPSFQPVLLRQRPQNLH